MRNSGINKIRSGVVVSAVAAFVAMAGATAATAADVICANSPTAPLTGSFGDVEVPAGAVCFMDGADVANVKVYGALRARRSIFRGDIQAEPGHDSVMMPLFAGVGNLVHGDVQIKGGVGLGFSGIVGATIHGDLQAEGNLLPLVFGINMIGGDLQVFRNTGIFVVDNSSANIGGNMIGGDLQCKGNEPPPLVSPLFGSNAVEGDKEDQCGAAFGF